MTATASRPTTGLAGAIPGPDGDRLLGMARALRRDLLGTLHAGFERYGDVVAYRIGPAPGPRRVRRLVVALHHPDDVRRVFTDTDVFTRRTTTYGVLHELFGTNLVTAEGEGWQRRKRLLQPLFTRAATSRYAALMAEEARAVVEGAVDSPSGAIDALRSAERYTLRVLGRTLFKDERGVDDDTVAALARLVPVVGAQVVERARRPLRLPLEWPTPRNRRFAETRDALHATIERVLARRQHAADDAGLLGELRRARDPEGERPLSDEEVRDEALIFLMAGYTTTSNALCSTLYLLGRHTRTQQRVAEGGDELVLAAVQESLRLHPPSYVLGRRVGDAGAEVAGYELPAGTDVLVSAWITHRHPAFWSEPERFDPWRFVGEHERSPYAWFPFGGGARACIGRHLALLESTILLRALLERCRLESRDAVYPTSQLISMRPSGPVRIACRPR